MRKIKGFSLVEMACALVVLSFIFMITVPTMVSSTADKIYISGYSKAVKTISAAVNYYLEDPENSIEPTVESAQKFIKFFIEKAYVSGLYEGESPSQTHEPCSNIIFGDGTIVGSANVSSISNVVNIQSKPSFWITTDDNIAYSIIIPNNAQCGDVLNINTAKNLSETIRYSCFVIITDTNGLFKFPNTIEETEDITDEIQTSNLKNDRYYIFIGSNGAAIGNPKHILSAKLYKP